MTQTLYSPKRVTSPKTPRPAHRLRTPEAHASASAVSAITIFCHRPSRQLRASNRSSKNASLFEDRALCRAVLLRSRPAFADLTFPLSLAHACAGRRQATSVPPLDRVRQAACGDAAEATVLSYFIFSAGIPVRSPSVPSLPRVCGSSVRPVFRVLPLILYSPEVCGAAPPVRSRA